MESQRCWFEPHKPRQALYSSQQCAISLSPDAPPGLNIETPPPPIESQPDDVILSGHLGIGSESFAGQRKGLQYFGSLLLGSKPSTLAFTNVTWLDMKHSEPKMKNRGEAKSEIGLDDASLFAENDRKPTKRCII